MTHQNELKENIYKSSKYSPFRFSPKDISIKDDAFHGSKASRFTEWWYFDAVFDNGYSIELNIRVLSVIKDKLVLIYKRTDIYKDGKLIRHRRKRCRKKDFDTSQEKPSVKIERKEFIKGYKDKNGDLLYDISFEFNDVSTDLHFKSTSKGWKGTNPGGDKWAVILPRAEVHGTITIDDKKINVKGIGYHDHNWDVRYSAAKNNHGWFWGKIYTDSYTVTWATIYKNRNLGQPLLVINESKKGYTNFEPKQIKFIGDKLSLENKKMIPLHFLLEAKNKKANLKFSMDAIDLHHDTVMLKYHYWRYHMLCKGSITIGKKTEKVNDIQIAEFLRFRD